jgi:hypothetical protein
MSWLEKLLPPKIQKTDPAERRTVPDGLWIKCPSCEAVLYRNDLENNQNVCPQCGHHHRIGARARLNAFLDAEGRYELGQEVIPVDALKFKDSRKYPERLKEALESTGETDALIVMGGAVQGVSLVAACFEFEFYGWEHGIRRRRTIRPGRGSGGGSESPVPVLHGHRRSAYAGGTALPHANGQDQRSSDPPCSKRTSLCQRTDGSHHGRLSVPALLCW